jgi:predicted transcriptional regulator
MKAITINLPDERIQKLQEIAHSLGITPEELARASVHEFLSRPEESFQKTMEYVLDKNKELYKRLS